MEELKGYMLDAGVAALTFSIRVCEEICPYETEEKEVKQARCEKCFLYSPLFQVLKERAQKAKSEDPWFKSKMKKE